MQTRVYEIRFEQTQFNDKFRRIKTHRIYDLIYSMRNNIASPLSGFAYSGDTLLTWDNILRFHKGPKRHRKDSQVLAQTSRVSTRIQS